LKQNKGLGNTNEFYRRIWSRLQRLSTPEYRICRLQGCKEIAKANCDGLCKAHRTAARLVFPEDHSVIGDFASLIFEQMQPCFLIESDKRDGSNPNLANEAPGLECRHCIGRPGHVRYFPAHEASLHEMGACELFLAHLRLCASCPEQVSAFYE
jgi:hypothetical protein